LRVQVARKSRWGRERTAGAVLIAGLLGLQALGDPTDAGATQHTVDFERARAKFLNPRELLQAAEASKTAFTVETSRCADVAVNQFAALTWQKQAPELENPAWVKRPDGSLDLAERPTSPEAARLVDQAERLYDAKEYEKAAAAYRKVLEVDPSSDSAQLGLGDCAYRQHRFEEALPFYRLAEQANPASSLSFHFRGDALVALGRVEEAREAYLEALIREPRRTWLQQDLDFIQTKLGLLVQDNLFHPMALARRRVGDVQVCLVDTTPHWLAYGMCKALWIGRRATAWRGRVVRTITSLGRRKRNA
jgi:tetratricopeptide (TPR) repeat protein